MMCDYMRSADAGSNADDAWLAGAKRLSIGPKFLDEFEQLILQNEIVIARTQNVGKLSPELAISAGSRSDAARCGVNYDLRKVDGLRILSRFKFRIPLGDHGDTYDRLMMRALEMRESVEILKQALAQIQPGR